MTEDDIYFHRKTFVTNLAVKLALEVSKNENGFTVSTAAEVVRAAKEIADKLEENNDQCWVKEVKNKTKRRK